MKIERIFTKREIAIIASVVIVIVIITIISIFSIRQSKDDSLVSSDANSVLSAMQKYSGNHAGNYPSASTTDISAFIKEYNLPSHYQYSFGSGNAQKEQMILSNLDCDGNIGASVHFYRQDGGSSCID